MVVENNEHEANSGVERKERKPVARMIPLLSRRSIIVLVIGLVVGAALGLGYWFMSPSLAPPITEEGSGGLAAAMVQPTSGPYESRVNIQVVNPGSSYMRLGELLQKGEYYAAKANGFPFFEFLSLELDKKAPEYSHTIDELNEMIRIRYEYDNELPTIGIKVTGSSDQEASFLSAFIPQVFQEYLIAEESNMRLQEYQDALEQIEKIRAAFSEAKRELSTITLQRTPNAIYNDSTYLVLNAKIESLEIELERQMAQLATLIAEDSANNGNITQSQEEEKALLDEVENTRIAILQAEQELSTLTLQRAANDISNDPDYLVLKAKIESLKLELEPQTAKLATLIAEGSTSWKYEDILVAIERVSTALAEANNELSAMENQARLDYVALDLSYQIAEAKVESLKGQLTDLTEKLSSLSDGTTQRQDYAATLAAVERTSTALSEAKSELSILEAQAGVDHLATDLDYQNAKTNTDNLYGKLASLTEEASSLLAGNTGELEAIDYLAVGNPSMPVPVLPERMRARNVLMAGAVIGIGGAWVALNFKWLVKGMPQPPAATNEEEDDA